MTYTLNVTLHAKRHLWCIPNVDQSRDAAVHVVGVHIPRIMSR